MSNYEADRTNVGERKPSGLGLASFIIALAAGVGLLLVMAAIAVMTAADPEGVQEKPAASAAIGLFAVVLTGAEVVALCLGVAGLVQRDRTRALAILGTVLSGLALAGMLGLFLLGVMAAA